MTFAYQPSAAGISWLSMCQNTVSTMEREQALLALSATTTDVQTNLTLTDSNQTLKSLNDQAQATEQSAWGQITGAVLGGVVSVTTLSLSLSNLSGSSETPVNRSMKIDELEEPVQPINSQRQNALEMDVLGENPKDSAEIVAQGPVKDAAPGAPSKTAAEENMTTEQAKKATMAKFWQEHGNNFSSFINTGTQGIFTTMSAQSTEKQAQDKALEAVAQGIASVMGSMQGMIASAISSCDTFFNNTEGNFTTIIQVSAVRG